VQDAQEELLWNVVEMERSVKIFMNVEGRLPRLLFGGFHGKRSLLFGRGGSTPMCTLCRSVHKYITPQVYASFDNAIFITSSGPAFPLCVSEQRAAADHF
jgi:hypothetical protein